MSKWTNAGLNTVHNISDFAQNLYDPSIKLGVTGLSRSGKTVFITSLIYHLLHRTNLKFFEAHTSGRISKVYLEPHPNDLLPRFDYEGNLSKLTNTPPSWPQGTKHISQLRLTIEYQSDHFPNRFLGPSTIHIDIIDYPGEWLLDLPLLEKSYSTWCQEAFSYANQNQNLSLAKPWLEQTASISPNMETDEGQAKLLSDQFTTFLNAARQNARDLPTIPPGRFLMPGDLKGSPALTFAPLHLKGQAIQPDSLASLMQRRFEAYKEKIVRPFYRQFFTRLDRQIILVDVLSALNAGQDQILHLQENLTQILKSFNPGAPHWLTSLWNKKIDRLVFAATKADHLHHHNHDKLQAILKTLTQGAIKQAKAQGADIKVQALASLRTTTELTVEKHNETYSALKGTPVKGEIFESREFDGETEILFFPGDLPENNEKIFETTFLNKEQQELTFKDELKFTPPSPDKAPFMPHIRLDRAIDMLIGDKLR